MRDIQGTETAEAIRLLYRHSPRLAISRPSAPATTLSSADTRPGIHPSSHDRHTLPLRQPFRYRGYDATSLRLRPVRATSAGTAWFCTCLLYTSDAADDLLCV